MKSISQLFSSTNSSRLCNNTDDLDKLKMAHRIVYILFYTVSTSEYVVLFGVTDQGMW